jgi:RNA polymerase sigma factor (sigma-70 family)
MLTSELITRAAAGAEDAWHELVRRHAPVVWAVARTHRLDGADAADVSQNTWMALAEHLPRIRKPERVPAWLATTARRECLRVLTRGRREQPREDLEVPGTDPEPRILLTVRDRLLWQAFSSLPVRCREMLGLLAHAPALSYVQLSRALGLRMTSIGRTRARCLDQLRHQVKSLNADAD